MVQSSVSTERGVDSETSALPLDAWRLVVEAEIDTVVRELRKNALWAEVAERDGVGSLWVGGSSWPGLHQTEPEISDTPSRKSDNEPGDNIGEPIDQVSAQSLKNAAKIKQYMSLFSSRRSFGKAGVRIGMASFASKDDEDDVDDLYAAERVMMLESFLFLREAINCVDDPMQMSPQKILDPFLIVIRDPETTGPITRTALVSIQRFITNRVIDFSSPQAIPALLDLARAVTHCRFEATDAASDEGVLMQILNVLGTIMLSSGGKNLSDEVICEIMETVLSMSCQMRLSEMLRRSAESTLFTMVSFVFGKLNDIQKKDTKHRSYSAVNDNKGNAIISQGTSVNNPNGDAGVSMIMPSASSMLVNTDRSVQRSVSSSGESAVETMHSALDGIKPDSVPPSEKDRGNPESTIPKTQSNPSDKMQEAGEATLEAAAPEMGTTDELLEDTPQDSNSEATDAQSTQGFSLPSIRELYRVLVTLVNPRDLQYTDSMRVLALNTLQVVFQTAGPEMSEVSALRELTLGDLSHFLLRILQRDQPNLISPALRVLFLMFASHRRDMKGHLELFLCQTFGRIMSLPQLERQGSRTSLNGSASNGSGRSNRGTPRVGSKRSGRNVLLPSERKDDNKASCQKHIGDVGLGISESHEKGSITSPSDTQIGSPVTFPDERRRRSSASVHPPYPTSSAMGAPTPIISPLLEIECLLSYDQEIELYNEASLRKGVRGRVATKETRRQLLEGIHHLLTGDESLMTDLWVNFDCDIQRGNIYDFLISFITQHAVPWPDAPDDGEDEAFLDILLYHIIRIANRANVPQPKGKWADLLGFPSATKQKISPRIYSNQPKQQQTLADFLLSPVQLLDRKKHKETMTRAAQLFNEKPKEGIAYLQKVGELPSDNSADMTQQLAQFLYETPTINKKLLGEFLAKPSNLEVLQVYISLFDFSGRRLDEAMRSLLGTFRLPGESQQIERIMETFSETYFASGPSDVATKDAAFILSYAVIMLNTDQHSPQVRVRMKFEDFSRNLRGVNGSDDFRKGFLEDIYNAIRLNEIVFPEEHEGEAGFDYAWREILSTSPSSSPAAAWVTTRGFTAEYDESLLASTWPRLLNALARILTHFTNDHTMRLALLGIHALVASAAHYKMRDCVCESVRVLSQLTGLTDPTLHVDLTDPQVFSRSHGRLSLLDPEAPNCRIGIIAEQFDGQECVRKMQEEEDRQIEITRVGIEFGRDYKAQVSLVALLEIVSLWSSEISTQGWEDFLDVLSIAINADLIPHRLLQTKDILVDSMWVPRKFTVEAKAAAEKRVKTRLLGGGRQKEQANTGLFSALTSFLGGGGGGGNSVDTQYGASTPKREFRWRESPELLADLISRAKLALDSSNIESVVYNIEIPDNNISEFLTPLSAHFPMTPPSPPCTPLDHGKNTAPSSGGGSKTLTATASASAGNNGGAGSVNSRTSTSSASGHDYYNPLAINYSPASLFFFEWAVKLIEQSPERAANIWSPIEEPLHRTLEHADTLYSFTLERIVAGLLRIAIGISDHCMVLNADTEESSFINVIERVVRCLGLLRDAKDSTFESVALYLSAGIKRLIEGESKIMMRETAIWEIVRHLIRRLARASSTLSIQGRPSQTTKNTLATVIEIVILLKCGAIEPALYFADTLDILTAFMPLDRELLATVPQSGAGNSPSDTNTTTALDIANKLTSLLYDMQEIAKGLITAGSNGTIQGAQQESEPTLSSIVVSPTNASVYTQISPSRVMTNTIFGSGSSKQPSLASFNTMGQSIICRQSKTTPLSLWLSAMNALAAYCCTAHRDVRQQACTHVQRAISLGELTELGDGGDEWIKSTFLRVLFPLMDMLLRADLLADKGMEDTHARCISMLTMFFLHNANNLSNSNKKTSSGVAITESTKEGETLSDGGEEKIQNRANLAPLEQVWLRLIDILVTYIHTSNIAAAPSPHGSLAQSDPDAETQDGGPKKSDGREIRLRVGHLGMLAEMAEENIKNSMLVLESMGLFSDDDCGDGNGERNHLWQESWARIDKVNPRLKHAIFPSDVKSSNNDNILAVESQPQSPAQQQSQEQEKEQKPAPCDEEQQVSDSIVSQTRIGNKQTVPEPKPDSDSAAVEHDQSTINTAGVLNNASPELVSSSNTEAKQAKNPSGHSKSKRKNIIIVTQ